jgi:hypothetical protein
VGCGKGGTAATAVGGAAAWKLAADDDEGDGGGDALIDDDALLTEADRAKPAGEGFVRERGRASGVGVFPLS